MILRVSSSLICRHIVKQANPVFRNVSFMQCIKPRSVLLDKSKHKIIYEFPYITPLSAFIRTKFWVPSLMTFITPVGLLFAEIRFTVLGGLISSWLHSAVVHQMSKFAQNIIGKIYVNEENISEHIIISSMNIYGNRIDRLHKQDDLVVCDYSTKFSHAMGFIKIYVNNTDLVYQLNVVNCKVFDQKIYTSLFGSNLSLQKNKEKTV